ncbi:universal stress protein [Natribaculum luteum]|uniref:Universal stress protein n=1 Tax=Natribaculum luteum TaxID=1586232 RepID=A0ABD5NX37_9EURY|nr:universal stress protein [Natribaculum luteum]
MTERILVPTDGSDGATAALEHAIDHAADREATIHALYVADVTRDEAVASDSEVLEVFEQRGSRFVADAVDRAERRDVTVVDAVERGTPHETILEYAGAHDVDLLVMGTHGRRGFQRFFLGSVAERVVRMADVPVLTVNDTGASIPYPYEDVLIATDGSECARVAATHGVELAATHDATVHVVSVVDASATSYDVAAGQLLEALEVAAEETVETAATSAREAGVSTVETAVEVGSVSKELTAYADDHDVDLVVTGTHGRCGVDRYVMGSVAERVVRTAPCPVLTVSQRTDE